MARRLLGELSGRPNNCVNLSVRPVTRVARATRAPVRPAGYAERSAEQRPGCAGLNVGASANVPV